MFILNFAFKNVASRKSSYIIILFIAFSIGIMVLANAIFDGTGNGIEKTFSSSFTGDVVIKPVTDFTMSLFGDETPVVGKLSELPRITPYNNVIEFIKEQPEIENFTSQLTGQVVLRINGNNIPAIMFGVNAKDYLKIMDAIKIVDGEPYELEQKGIMINKNMQQNIFIKTGIELKPNSEVQLASSNGSSFTLRTGVVSGIFDYQVHNDLQDNLILVDPETVRSLLGIESMSLGKLDIEKKDSILIDEFDDFENFDDMFADNDLFSSDFEFPNEENNLKIDFQENEVQENQENFQTTWNYIICKLKPNESPNNFVKKLNKFFQENEYNVTATTWRAAAGMSALYVYWMRLIFNIGLILLIGTGFIIVNNTLVIAAIDRTKETGALRAIGADRKFIAIEYLAETLMITVTAGILGCILGYFGNQILLNSKITFSNTFLIQLFGGEQLNSVVTLANLVRGMLLSFVLAVFAWFYPVHIALDTSPVVAMEHI